MTRFIYIADTHIGADPLGWQQQPGYPTELPYILSALCGHLTPDKGIDFILHGGDMIDATTEENILAAAKAFDLPVPVYLCLGNHDITTTDAVDKWFALAPQFFIGSSPNYTVGTEDCMIHVAPNQWGDIPFFWDLTQRPHLSPAQVQDLSEVSSKMTDLPHMLLTHSPVFGLPTEQTGFADPYHSPDQSFTDEITAVAEGSPSIKCVLGAHNHLNMRIDKAGVDYITVSSLVETPFEVKLFEVTPQTITMNTIRLSEALPFEGTYDTDRSFVQGRSVDRSCTRHFKRQESEK